jgi:hypothetical protein
MADGGSIADLVAHLGLDVDAGSFDSAREALDKLAQVEMQAVIDKANEMAKAMVMSTGEMTAALVAMRGEAARNLQKAVEVIGIKLPEAHKKAAEAAHHHGEQLHWVKHALGGVIGLHAAKHLFHMTEHTIHLGAAMGDLADKTGISLDEIQELGYAANIHGISTDQMANTLSKLAVNLDKAGKKGGEAAEPFKKAGIAIKDASGKVRPSGEVFADIADHLQGLDESARPAAIMKFGKQFKDLIPLMKGGSEGLEKLRQEARDFGLVMSQETVDAMDKVEKNTKRLGKAWEGLKEHAIASLVPALKDLTENLLVWVKENKEDIAGGLQAVFKVVIGAIKLIAVGIKVLIKIVAFLAKNWGLVVAAVMGVAVAFAILERAAIQAAVKSAWAWIAHPVFLLGAAIALAILLLDDLYAWVTGQNSLMGELIGPIDEVLATVEEKIKAAFERALEWVKKKAEEVWDAITGSIDFDDVTKKAARQQHEKGNLSDAALAEAEKFGAGGGDIEKVLFRQDQQYIPQLHIPASTDANAGMTTVHAPITNNVTITGDADSMKRAWDEHSGVQVRQLEVTIGGAKKR